MPFTECQLRRGCTSQAGRIRRTGTRRQRQKHLLLPAQIAIRNTTRDRPSGRSFFCFGANTPTPEFCENSRERGPRSPAGTAQGFDPPLGAQQNAAARGGGCAGVGRARRKDGDVPRRARRGRFSPGRGRQGAVPGDAAGASGARRAGAFLPGCGRKPGAGRLARVRRTKAAWWARRRGAGTLPGGGARAVYGGFPGRTRGRRVPGRRYTAGGTGITGAAGFLPGRGGRRRRTGEKRSELRGLCRVTGHRWGCGSGASEKARFRNIRKRFSRGAGFVDSELICPQKLVAMVGVHFRRRRVMNVSRRAGRAKSPAGKQNAIQRKEHTP